MNSYVLPTYFIPSNWVTSEINLSGYNPFLDTILKTLLQPLTASSIPPSLWSKFHHYFSLYLLQSDPIVIPTLSYAFLVVGLNLSLASISNHVDVIMQPQIVEQPLKSGCYHDIGCIIRCEPGRGRRPRASSPQ